MTVEDLLRAAGIIGAIVVGVGLGLRKLKTVLDQAAVPLERVQREVVGKDGTKLGERPLRALVEDVVTAISGIGERLDLHERQLDSVRTEMNRHHDVIETRLKGLERAPKRAAD